MGKAGTLPPQVREAPPGAPDADVRDRGAAVDRDRCAILLVGLLLAPGDIFAFLGTITTLAVIVLYIMANFALTAYILREHRDDYSFWKHLVLPGIGTLALLPVLWTHRVPVPAPGRSTSCRTSSSPRCSSGAAT